MNTNINPSAESARESARNTDGTFGRQPATEPAGGTDALNSADQLQDVIDSLNENAIPYTQDHDGALVVVAGGAEDWGHNEAAYDADELESIMSVEYGDVATIDRYDNTFVISPKEVRPAADPQADVDADVEPTELDGVVDEFTENAISYSVEEDGQLVVVLEDDLDVQDSSYTLGDIQDLVARPGIATEVVRGFGGDQLLIRPAPEASNETVCATCGIRLIKDAAGWTHSRAPEKRHRVRPAL